MAKREYGKLAAWFCGLVMGIFLMVGDELISLGLYCGLRCYYPIPFVGQLDVWDAWALTFGVEIAIMFTTLLALMGEKSRAA